MNARTLFRVVVLIGGVALLATITPPLDPRIGATDFRDLWTASYLLAHHDNMYDAARVLDTQRALTAWTESYPLVTLSPPWVALLTMPYAQLSFARATWLWLLTNIFLAGLSAIVLWRAAWQRPERVAVRDGNATRTLWVAFLAVFGFSITLTALASGQTTLFVLAMVAVYVASAQQQHEIIAGLALAGMMIKPPMVFVTLPLLGLEALRARRWRRLAVSALTGFAALGALWVLRATWLDEYREALRALDALAWESSNLGGLLLVLTDWIGAKLLGLIALPIGVWVWWQYGARVPLRAMIDFSLIVSLIAAPYGFSYDQVVLLPPSLTLLTWIAQKRLRVGESIVVLGVLLVADALSFYERVLSPSEVYFFWIPLVVGGAYAYGAYRVRQHMLDEKATPK